jgi:hypothetical protein
MELIIKKHYCSFISDMLTTTPMPVTTASPTTMAVVTTQAPQQTTTAAVMVTTQAPQPTTAAATQAPTTVGMNITMPVVTAAHVSTNAPSMFKLYNQRL